MIIIEELLRNEEKYNKIYNGLIKDIKDNFEKIYPSHPENKSFNRIEFKFYEDDCNSFVLTKTQFIYQLIMLLPFMRLGLRKDIKLDKSFIFDFKNMNNNTLADYIDIKVTPYYTKRVDLFQLNEVYAEWLTKLAVSKDFTLLLTRTYSMVDDIEYYHNNKRYREILETKMDENLMPKDIEREIAKVSDELVKMIKTDPKHHFHEIMNSGEGIKKGQLSELLINAGYKPDIYGNLLPIPLNTNYIYHGLESVSDYAIDGNSGRKAAIMTDKFIGLSGYLARKINLIALDTQLSNDDDSNCNSHPNHLLPINIKTQEYLDRLIGRYYINEDGEYEKIDIKDKSLIGKTLKFRSPISCSHKEKDKDGDSHDEICHKCFGDLAYFNKPFHIGVTSASRISKPISQDILSSKHLLQANSAEINFSEEFTKYFQLTYNMITINEDLDDDRLDSIFLIIYPTDINEDGEEDDDDDEESDLYKKFVNKFSVYDAKIGAEFPIEITTSVDGKPADVDIYITPQLEKLIRKGKETKIKIKFSKLVSSSDNNSNDDDDDFNYMPLFNMEIVNNELTKPLHDLKKVLDIKKDNNFKDIDEAVQRAFDLIIEAKINSQFVQFEVIFRNLVRDAENILERPDFKKEEIKYIMMTVSEALAKNPSLSVSISFEDLKRQVINPLTYKKSSLSVLDKFYCIIPEID